MRILIQSSSIRAMLAIAILGNSSLGYLSSAYAQSLQPSQVNESSLIVFNAPTPPVNRGAPTGRRRGGASRRGPCDRYLPLTAIVPVSQKTVYGKTTHDHPTFWFYLPEKLDDKTTLEFILQDSNDQYIHNLKFNAPQTAPGLIQLTVPSTAPALKVEQSYLWTMVISCQPNSPSTDISVQGTIQRVELNPVLQKQLLSTSALEQAKLYAKNGIWYDSFNSLATLYRKNPGDRQLQSAWNTLLQQVELDSLATVPFSSCCTSKP